MKKINASIATLVCLVLLSAHAFAGQKNNNPEVLFSGDSWVTVPCFFESIDDAFFNRGVNVGQGDCFGTSHIGANADNFQTKYAAKFNETLNRLKTRPNVKAVYLSLGGNDMFKYWQKTMTPAAEAALFVYIRGYVVDIVNAYHKVRPDVWVLVSGYDNGYMYANNPIASYREIYEHMGSPTPLEVYGGFSRFAEAMSKISLDHTVFQQHIGLMHYYYGAPEANVPPFQTLAPQFISPASDPAQMGGVPGVRNNKIAQAHIFNYFYDPHHLRPNGFMRVFEHAIDGYIGKWVNGASYEAPSPEKDLAEDAQNTEVSDDVQAKVLKMIDDEYSKMYSGD
jgi:hypothetical protein